MLYSEEQIRRANERSITEYFRQAGYSCKRVGSETHIEGFGEFYVKDTTVPNQFYVHSQQKSGVGLVSCLMKVMNMPFKEAVRAALDGELGQEERTESVPNYAQLYRKAELLVHEPKPEFIMPEKGENDRRVFGYLIFGERLRILSVLYHMQRLFAISLDTIITAKNVPADLKTDRDKVKNYFFITTKPQFSRVCIYVTRRS